eukprot:bmy_12449T0
MAGAPGSAFPQPAIPLDCAIGQLDRSKLKISGETVTEDVEQDSQHQQHRPGKKDCAAVENGSLHRKNKVFRGLCPIYWLPSSFSPLSSAKSSISGLPEHVVELTQPLDISFCNPCISVGSNCLSNYKVLHESIIHRLALPNWYLGRDLNETTVRNISMLGYQEDPNRVLPAVPFSLTVTSTQCKSGGCSAPSLNAGPASLSRSRSSASRPGLLTRRMSMSFSQQNAWIRVKWICRATSLSSSSSAASRHSTTLSGSLRAGTGLVCPKARPAAWAPAARAHVPGVVPRPACSPWDKQPQGRWKAAGSGAAGRGDAPGRRPLRARAGRGTTRDTRGLHLHVEQLGRLVHPDGDGALTQGFAEHFLEGIPHLIHPTRRQSKGIPSARRPSGPSRPPRPAPRPSLPSARATAHLGLCKPGAPRAVTPPPREFLQSHIATAGALQRESGLRAAPATAGARVPAFCTPSQAPPAPAAAAPSAPPAPSRSLARRLSAPNLATVHYNVAAAASQPLKDKGPARRSYPANPQPTTTRLICIRAAIGLCKSACSDNLTSAPGTRLRGAEEGGATRKASLGAGAGRGAGIGEGGVPSLLSSCWQGG